MERTRVTTMDPTLPPGADAVRDAVHRIEARLGGTPRVLREGLEDADLANPGTMITWVYQSAQDAAIDVPDALTVIGAEFEAEGWSVTTRDAERELGLQLTRDGCNVGVIASRTEPSVVLGGSSAVAPAEPA